MSNENSWSKASIGRSFADVLKGKAGTLPPPAPAAPTATPPTIVPSVPGAKSAWTSPRNSPAKMSPHPSPALQAARSRSPISVSPVTVSVNSLGASTTSSTNTVPSESVTIATNTDLPRTPVKAATAVTASSTNTWTSPFFRPKNESVSSETQTPGETVTTPPITRSTSTTSTQTRERLVSRTSEAGTSMDKNSPLGPKKHLNGLFESEAWRMVSTTATSPMQSVKKSVKNSGTTMASSLSPLVCHPTTDMLYGPPRVHTSFPASPSAANGGSSGGKKQKSTARAGTSPSHKNVDTAGADKTHTFRPTKSPFVPSFMRAHMPDSSNSALGGLNALLGAAGKTYDMKDSEEVVSGSFLTRLSREVVDFEKYTNQMTDMFEEHINKCINKTKHVIFTTLKQFFKLNPEGRKRPDIEVHGSFATKLWLPSSDIDMVVQGVSGRLDEGKSAMDLLHEATRMLQIIAGGLEKEPWVGNVMMITTSNMPVIKFYAVIKKGEIQYKFPFDVSIDPGATPSHVGFTHAHTGLPAKKMITHFLSVMPEFRAIMLVLKQLLRERGLNDTYRGGLSSYGLALIVTRYLQPFYPNLMKGVDPDEWWVQAFTSSGSQSAVAKKKMATKNKHKGKPPAVTAQKNAAWPPGKPDTSPVIDTTPPIAPAIVSPMSLTPRPNLGDDSSTAETSRDAPLSAAPVAARSWASLVAGNGPKAETVVASSTVSVNKLTTSPVQSSSASVPSSSPMQVGLDAPPGEVVEVKVLDESSNDCHSNTTASPQEPEHTDVNGPLNGTEHQADKRYESMGETLLDFLHYFGTTFDFEKNGISIRDGGMYFQLNETRGSLWIDDPITPGNNVASSTFNAPSVLSAFRDAFFAIIRHETSDHYPTLLSRVIRSQPWLPHFCDYAVSDDNRYVWDSRKRASPQEYELAAKEIREEIKKLSLERQRALEQKRMVQSKATGRGGRGKPANKVHGVEKKGGQIAGDRRSGNVDPKATPSLSLSSSGSMLEKQKQIRKHKSLDQAEQKAPRHGGIDGSTKNTSRSRTRNRHGRNPNLYEQRIEHSNDERPARSKETTLTLASFLQ
jgi:DNA polymerase sigma